MAERASPEIQGFKRQKEYKLIFKRKFIPWVKVVKNPYSIEFQWRYKWASSFCRNKIVLDVPCGMGWGTSLVKNAKQVYGIDISQEAINEAITRYGNRIQFEQGSMEKLNFDDHTFDTVVCLEGIEHVPPEVGEEFIIESHRVLRHKGILLMSSPQHETRKHSGNPYHVKEYSPVELMALLYPKFDILNMVTRKVDKLHVHYFIAQKR